jgi:uncharacterized damage-inducible protein DinB
MYNQLVLLEAHQRTHVSLGRMLNHLASLPGDSWNQSLPGFAYPTLVAQLEHALGAEVYWIRVLLGEPFANEGLGPDPKLDDLVALRDMCRQQTRDWLSSTPEQELEAVVTRSVWGGKTREVRPALVFLRILTHYYHHLGQMQAMCRLVGHPVGALDFPLDPEPWPWDDPLRDG